MRRNDITGNKYEMLTVVRYTGGKCGIHYEVECICDCGNLVKTSTNSVIQGARKSCGCKKIKHGMCDSPEYSSWKGMKSRCYIKSNRRFQHYGGRGIKVCDRWKGSFENFFADMGEKPTSAHSLERIDVNGDYEPSNCEWATPDVQSRNRRLLGSKTNAKGVHPMPDGKTFKASISVNDKTIHIGVFGSVDEAVQARVEAEKKYWGAAYAR